MLQICCKTKREKTEAFGWCQAAAMLKSGEITQEEYDRWRYHYPKFDTSQRWAKVPSQALSDMLVEAFNDNSQD